MTERTILLCRFLETFGGGNIAKAMINHADYLARTDVSGKTDPHEVLIDMAKELETVARRVRKAVKEGDCESDWTWAGK